MPASQNTKQVWVDEDLYTRIVKLSKENRLTIREQTEMTLLIGLGEKTPEDFQPRPIKIRDR